jgi:SAM-dependent methyltransferase
MADTAPDNEAQRRYWNEPGGAVWTAWQERMDTQLAPFGDAVLGHMQVPVGSTVADIGCGCGQTTLQAARSVGPNGTAIGIDISEPMLARARARAEAEQLANVRFLSADAQVVRSESLGAPVDGVISRFGVMFFADPRAAFHNMAMLCTPNASLSFVCWQAPRFNDWMAALGRALAPMFPNQPPTDPLAPGPFAFADPDRVRSILHDSGWSSVAIDPCIRSMQVFGTDDFDTAVTGSLLLGGAARLLNDASDEQRIQAQTVAQQVMRSMWSERGAIVDGACWLVSARRAQ